MSEVVRLSDVEAVAQEAAKRWVEIARAAVAERGVFDIALSGGSTPSLLYRMMATQPWCDQVPWGQTAVFWGDERRVPASHADSNYRMARDLLLDHVSIPPQQIYRMPSEGLMGSDARDYEEAIRRHFNLSSRDWPRFDLMLLGMGADGHIASIFPGTRAISDRSNMVLVYEVPQLRTERMTLGMSVINHARNILLMVTGDEKAKMVHIVLEESKRTSTYPAQAIEPVDGNVVWLLDRAAASLLSD